MIQYLINHKFKVLKAKSARAHTHTYIYMPYNKSIKIFYNSLNINGRVSRKMLTSSSPDLLYRGKTGQLKAGEMGTSGGGLNCMSSLNKMCRLLMEFVSTSMGKYQ